MDFLVLLYYYFIIVLVSKNIMNLIDNIKNLYLKVNFWGWVIDLKGLYNILF